MGGDATGMEVALSDMKGTGATEDMDGLGLGLLYLTVDEGLHPSMEHALRSLTLSDEGGSELSVESAASLLKQLERSKGRRGLPGGNMGL